MLPGCLMGTDRQTWRVTVTTDKQVYRPDERIRVTIYNGLAQVIYAVPGLSDNAIVHLEQQVGTQWLPRDTGRVVHPAFLIAIEPQRIITGVLDPVPSPPPATSRPHISKPTEPEAVQKDLRTLPPSKPWTPGDPIREIPQQRAPSQAQQAEMHSDPPRWNSGTYRLVARFRIGTPDGPPHLSNSSPFVVTA